MAKGTQFPGNLPSPRVGERILDSREKLERVRATASRSEQPVDRAFGEVASGARRISAIFATASSGTLRS